ncbi:chromate transporter-domain-containing protein [Fusarium oxysporum f. sp. albedinis]|nr:chromate transporter-domain-containing protein [Fusarium oxysporum f. sp. albedinis]
MSHRKMAIQQSARLNISNLGERFWNTIRENWYLGFASFGGPPVHFKIFHDKFVAKLSWIDEQMSKANKWVAIGLPGALGMYGLSIGVSNIGESLPRAVYALLSGLNAATVGIIVLAAVQLSEKAITDKITRILVFLGASAGMMYNALWYLLNYFPLLMFLAGVATVVHDFRWLHRPIKVITARFQKKAKHSQNTSEEGVEMQIQRQATASNGHKEFNAGAGPSSHGKDGNRSGRIDENGTLPLTEREASAVEDQSRIVPQERRLNISWKFGVLLIVLFLLSFIVVMVLRGTLPYKSRLYSLFANMYLAGTIIFGGGPVVIPLLREYVVAENWVSPRDFLIGLALIQAFPGPNFNFAVYLGSLTAINGGYNSAAGAILGFLGIFIPGLLTVHGTMGAWSAIRGWRWVKSSLRGVNAAAVGLTYTAVYRFQQGTSLAVDPWWVVVTATSYVGGYWFRVSPPVAIGTGAVMGLIWYGVVSD